MAAPVRPGPGRDGRSALDHGGPTCTPAPDDAIPWYGGVPADAPGRVPTRLWYGAGDEYLKLEHGLWYDERIAGLRLEKVDGAGHLLPVLRWRQIIESR